MILAIVNNYLVTDIMTIDDSAYAKYAQGAQAAIDVTAYSPQPQVGWIFNGSDISAPPGAVQSWKITKLAFRERFTTAELIGILTAAAGANTTGYELQIMMQNQALATFIDLTRSDTQAGVGFLVSLGLLTSGRATIILTTPPIAIELYQG